MRHYRAALNVRAARTRNIKRLKENALSVMVRLQDAQLERLYGILRERPVSGDRYAATSMATIDA